MPWIGRPTINTDGAIVSAGFNSAVYVERREKKVVGVIFGERSTARFYKRMGTLIDQAFENTR